MNVYSIMENGVLMCCFRCTNDGSFKKMSICYGCTLLGCI